MPDFTDRSDPQERPEGHRPEQADEDERQPRVPLPDDEKGKPDAQDRHQWRDERHLDQPGQRFEVAGQRETTPPVLMSCSRASGKRSRWP